ncbi:MAG TPA: rhodanese-like domain-containing protein [Methylibium sp.]|uniref:rhodanese-like domain-containing protein n=1 Tax=Methylibium sp. TaxID=2067992 RepID=UPI002DB561A2|nr:rhodanese-like domain-containing protein [Methylibium sp.]HEU4460690.1 rhodanese-like domain-containing protein [Methylibium sp.]
MKFLLDQWHLVLTALVSGGLLAWPALRGARGGSQRISTAEAVQLINREKAVLIDISEPAEYASGHAVNSRNVPFGSLSTGHKALPSNKALPLLVLCPTGARAQRAVGVLKKLGYERSMVVGGGLAAWREAQLPVEKSAA